VSKSRAILLRKIPLTDTSLIVSWCCPELGLIKTAAKGARRPGSALAGQLDLFYEVEIEFIPAKRGDLHTLREASVLNYRHGLQASYLRVLAASYFVRLIELVAERETPIPTLHDLLERGLNWLCDHEPTVKGVLHFEKELAKTLGLYSDDDPTPAIRALQEIYHHVPEQRLLLLEKLG
jgi:DNA repair protein RecO (recombination protein O)